MVIDAVVSARDLSKWYGQVIGLNDVSVTVPSGITGLLGPNGAGKSTFMKLVTGQLKPSKGSITVLGEPIWGNPALYFKIGFCPEQDAFYERMTGLEWVTALVRLNGESDGNAAALARRALDRLDAIEDRLLFVRAERPLGGEGPGGDRVQADAVDRPLHGERARHRQHARLGRRRGQHERGAAGAVGRDDREDLALGLPLDQPPAQLLEPGTALPKVARIFLDARETALPAFRQVFQRPGRRLSSNPKNG